MPKARTLRLAPLKATSSQHFKGGGPWPRYIDAEVSTGAKGVSTDGVRPGGLLGQTFDADSDRRDGKRGKALKAKGPSMECTPTICLSDSPDLMSGSTSPPMPMSLRPWIGEFSSGKQHYDKHGIHEARSINWSGDSIEFDELFYLTTYVDAAMAVSKGEFDSGAHHYVKVGRQRGYAPNPTDSGTIPEGALADKLRENTPKTQPPPVSPLPTTRPIRSCPSRKNVLDAS